MEASYDATPVCPSIFLSCDALFRSSVDLSDCSEISMLFFESIVRIYGVSLDLAFCNSMHRLAALYAVENSSSIVSISIITFFRFSISLFCMYSFDKDVIASIALSMALSILSHASSISLLLGNLCLSIKNNTLFQVRVKLVLALAFSLFNDISISVTSDIPFSSSLYLFILLSDAILSEFPRFSFYKTSLTSLSATNFGDTIFPMNEVTPKTIRKNGDSSIYLYRTHVLCPTRFTATSFYHVTILNFLSNRRKSKVMQTLRYIRNVLLINIDYLISNTFEKIREIKISNDFLKFIYQFSIEFWITNTLLHKFFSD